MSKVYFLIYPIFGRSFWDPEYEWLLMPTCFENLPEEILWQIYDYSFETIAHASAYIDII